MASAFLHNQQSVTTGGTCARTCKIACLAVATQLVATFTHATVCRQLHMAPQLLHSRIPCACLQAKVATAQAAAQSPSGLGEVGPLLGKAASAYRRLYSSAAAAGLEVPYEANLNNVGSLVWLEQLMVRRQSK